MTVKYDLMKLSERRKKRITRISDKLHGAFPEIETIIINRKQGVEEALEFDDFELFPVFFHFYYGYCFKYLKCNVDFEVMKSVSAMNEAI